MTAPSGPVPLRDARSMPVSLAILLAAGDASMRVAKSPFDPPLANGEIGGFGCVTGLTCESGTETRAGAAASPGAKMTAILFPTGTSSPAEAVTFAKIPEAGASISTVALSVSISMSGSPLVTDWPSVLSQLSRVPVSCATPSAGMITSVAIIVGCLSQEGVRREAAGTNLVGAIGRLYLLPNAYWLLPSFSRGRDRSLRAAPRTDPYVKD